MGVQFWWFYDVIAVATILICLFITVKRGFLKAAVSLLGYVLALFIALSLSSSIGSSIYSKSVRESNVKKMDQALSENEFSEELAKYLESLGYNVKVDRDKLTGIYIKGEDVDENIYTYLKTMTKDYGALTALSYYGKEISYEELFRHIDEAAKLLISIGVKSGDRVMYLMPNIPETAYFLYGGARIGAVADYIDPRPDSVDFTVSTKKVLAMFKEEKAKFLVSLDQCYLAMLKPIEQELKELGVEQTILVSASDSMDGKTKLNYLHETLSFNGLSALVKSVAKTKRIARLVDDARNGSLSRLSNYVDLIETAKNVELPDVEYRVELTDVEC